MARKTQSTGGDYEAVDWTDDWYPVFLNEIREIQPAGSIGYKNQPRKNAAAKVVWATDDEGQNWIFDTISLTPSMTTKGAPSKCLAIMCALAGRDPHNCGDPWIDDETLEFGFEQPEGVDASVWPVAGRITNGVKLMVRGEPQPDDSGKVWLRPEKYRARQGAGVQAAAAQVASVGQAEPEPEPTEEAIISEDGQWKWDAAGEQWVLNR